MPSALIAKNRTKASRQHGCNSVWWCGLSRHALLVEKENIQATRKDRFTKSVRRLRTGRQTALPQSTRQVAPMQLINPF